MRRTILTFIFLFLPFFATAHEWSQLYLEYKLTDTHLEGTIKFDASYGVPALRDDPKAMQPKREWLVARSPAETALMRKEAANYLRKAILFKNKIGDETHSLSANYQFPDWDSTPPRYPEEMDGFAYFTVKILVPLPEEGTLDMKIPWGIYPTVSMEVPVANGPSRFIAIAPANSHTFLTVVKKAPDPETGETKIEVVETEITTASALSNSFIQGFTHVIPAGLDHILFIAAICLILSSGKSLIHQSLIFTAAHSVTFGLLSSGVIELEGAAIAIIEFVIAGSIAALAIENLFVKKVHWHRLGLIFVFGLIHGLGFASAFGQQLLGDIGVADNYFWLSLIIANIGIEAAQVLIILVLFGLLKAIPKMKHKIRFCQVCSVIIALYALYLVIDRI